MSLEDLRIEQGNEVQEHTDLSELDALINVWVEETYRPIEIPATKIHVLVERALDNIPCDSIKSGIQTVREYLRDLFPQFSYTRRCQAMGKEESKRSLQRSLKEDLERGDLTIARINGKVVAMVGVKKWDYVAPNKYVKGDIYEIGKALTLPEVRDQGICRKVAEQAIENLRAKHGNIAIATGTKEEAVKTLCRKAGWREISSEEYLRMQGESEEHIRHRMNEVRSEPWTAFLYIPTE